MRQCQAPGCTRDADYEVFLYDFDLRTGQREIVSEQDPTCPFICERHAAENEDAAQGQRTNRAAMIYPYTNQLGAPGISIYRPLDGAPAAPAVEAPRRPRTIRIRVQA